MTPDLSPEAWAQIRYDYEHTERPVSDICAEHGVSAGTLRDRMRRWGWTRRRAPIPLAGPPPAPALPPDVAAPAACPQNETAAPWSAASPPAATGGDAGAPMAPDDRPIAERLQGAVARVLPAIEGTLATLGTGQAHPRELERAARALAALTRTLRELSGLLAQQKVKPACTCGGPRTPEQLDELRRELARKLEAFVASHTGGADGGAEPQP